MSKQLIVLSILFTLCLAGCTPVLNTPARLRIANTSAFTIEQVTIIFPNERIVFGSVAAGASSDYQTVSHGVYGYAAHELRVNGQTIEQPVVDWVGEQPLQGAQFTYLLTVDLQQPEGAQILSEVRVDSATPRTVTVAYVRSAVLYLQTVGMAAIPIEDCAATNCRIHYLKWSPDGEQLLYYWSPAQEPYGESPAEIRLADRKGKVRTVAKQVSYLQPPAWSPDGRHLAYLVATDRYQGPPGSACQIQEIWTAGMSSNGSVQAPRRRGEIGIDLARGGGGWSESADLYEEEGGTLYLGFWAAILEWTADDILLFSNTCFSGGVGRFHLGMGLELAPYLGGLHSLSLNAAKNAWVAIDNGKRMVYGIPSSLTYELVTTLAQPELVFFGQVTGDLYYTTLTETGRVALEDAVAQIQPAVNVAPYFEFTQPGLRVIKMPAQSEAILWENNAYAYARIAEGVDGALFFSRIEDNIELYEAIKQGKLTADNLHDLLPRVDVLWLPPDQSTPIVWLENAAQFALAPPINRINQ